MDTDEDDGPRALARPPLTLPEDFSVSVRVASPLLVLDFSVGVRADEAMRWRQYRLRSRAFPVGSLGFAVSVSKSASSSGPSSSLINKILNWGRIGL